MKITIVGAGNVGTQFAVHCASKGHKVTVYSSKPQKINKQLDIVDYNHLLVKRADIELATSKEYDAFNNAEIIFITMPSFCHKEIAKKILPYVKKGLYIGIVPGTGGGELAFRECIQNGAIIFGLQRVPSIARLVEYGKSVCAVGYRKELHIAALPKEETLRCCNIVNSIFDMPCIALPEYLNLTITPSNPILHTTRLRTIFKNYKQGVTYSKTPLFYEEWDNESSELLLKCDDEVQKICKALKNFDMVASKSLKVHYESDTVEQLTAKIRSIQAFKGLTTPVIKTDNGYIPDFSSRYFTADFSYGLQIFVEIAKMFEVLVPNMEETLKWYKDIVGNDYSGFDFKEYGIDSARSFIDFYKK